MAPVRNYRCLVAVLGLMRANVMLLAAEGLSVGLME